ncbi:MAG: hypothetical protein V1816_26520 [Pseudomonadota bacterium]
MQILIYAPPSEMEKQLWKRIGSVVTGEEYCLFYRVRDLASYLNQPRNCRGVCVFQASEEAELTDLAGMKTLLDDYHLVLVLPGQSERLTSLGHVLHPRFIDYSDGDLENLGVVLERMINQLKKRDGLGA